MGGQLRVEGLFFLVVKLAGLLRVRKVLGLQLLAVLNLLQKRLPRAAQARDAAVLDDVGVAARQVQADHLMERQ